MHPQFSTFWTAWNQTIPGSWTNTTILWAFQAVQNPRCGNMLWDCSGTCPKPKFLGLAMASICLWNLFAIASSCLWTQSWENSGLLWSFTHHEIYETFNLKSWSINHFSPSLKFQGMKHLWINHRGLFIAVDCEHWALPSSFVTRFKQMWFASVQWSVRTKRPRSGRRPWPSWMKCTWAVVYAIFIDRNGRDRFAALSMVNYYGCGVYGIDNTHIDVYIYIYVERERITDTYSIITFIALNSMLVNSNKNNSKPRACIS